MPQPFTFLGRETGGSGSLFSFYETAIIDERIPLLQYSGALGNEGAPRVDFTRGGLYLTVTIDPVSRQKLGTTRPKVPHVSPTCVAPQFISPLGVRSARQRGPDFGVGSIFGCRSPSLFCEGCGFSSSFLPNGRLLRQRFGYCWIGASSAALLKT